MEGLRNLTQLDDHSFFMLLFFPSVSHKDICGALFLCSIATAHQAAETIGFQCSVYVS